MREAYVILHNFLETHQAHERRREQNRRVAPEGIAEVPAGKDGGRTADFILFQNATEKYSFGNE